MREQAIEGFRLSPQQEHLWSRAGGGRRSPFRALTLVRLTGPLDVAALEAALARLVSRHEILRTTFHLLPGMTIPLQVVTDVSPVLVRRDLTRRPPESQPAELAALREAARQRPLPWEEGPLLEVTLVALAADRHALFLTLPALCCDAAGLDNLVAELSRCYAAVSTGDELGGEALDEEPMQYVDVAEWQGELLESEEAAEVRSYWRVRAAAAPPARSRQ